MDANKLCELHRQGIIDSEIKSRSIYAERLGDVDLVDGDMGENKCLYCGKVIPNRKAYCDTACSTEDKKKYAPLAKCLVCGTPFRKFPRNKLTCTTACAEIRVKGEKK